MVNHSTYLNCHNFWEMFIPGGTFDWQADGKLREEEKRALRYLETRRECNSVQSVSVACSKTRPRGAALLNNALRVVCICLSHILTLGARFVPFAFFQLMECCVNALVTSFKETILTECPGMIKRNETESEYGRSSGTKGSASSGWQWDKVPIYILPKPPHPSHHLCVCVPIIKSTNPFQLYNSIQL